jgi:hypothetical protein
MYTTIKALAAHARVHTNTVRRDIRLGMLRADKVRGIRGSRIPVTGRRGANDYLRLKRPGTPLINP